MHQTLLTTKLYFPAARLSLVSRPRLLARLQTGLQRPLILVSAPAGSGKTTLLAEWHSGPGSRVPVAWLSLDNEDNDISRFLTYLVTALGTLKEGIGESVLAIIRSPQPPPLQNTLIALINDLADALPASYVLVLDDYHVITSQLVHEAMIFLLDHMPPQMHLVLLTRADPPMPLARLRARNQLTEFRAVDLRFTPDEAASFLTKEMGLDLSAEDTAMLEERTEGWIAGLQLAALSLMGHSAEHISNSVAAFTGSHHYIVDYLVDEVLDHQTEPMRSFMLQTSILEDMTGPLCDALTKRTDGQATLETLERANLFVTALDNERNWYRYHPLFAEMLRNRLRQANPNGFTDLHRRAAGESFAHIQLSAVSKSLPA